MPGITTRLQAAKAVDEVPNDIPGRIKSRMQKVMAELNVHKENEGTIVIDPNIITCIDKIYDECCQPGRHVCREDLGNLVRLIDKENMVSWLSPESHVAMLKIILVSEEDVFQTQGLKLLLGATRDLKLPDGSFPLSHKLPKGSVVRSLLTNFLRNKRTDDESHQVARDLYAAYAGDIQMSATDSPMDVSKSRGRVESRSASPSIEPKGGQAKILDTFEDPSIFDIPDDDVEEEVLVDSQKTHKPNLVRFGPNGPRNQAVAKPTKKRKSSSGGVTAKGSPIGTNQNKRRKTAVEKINVEQATPAPDDQGHSRVVKKKDRLQDSAKKTNPAPLQSAKKKQQVRPKGKPTIIDLLQNMVSDGAMVDADNYKNPIPAQARQDSLAKPRSSTPSAPTAPQVPAGTERIQAEEQIFDLYTTINENDVIRQRPPEASVFSSPARAPASVVVVSSQEQHPDYSSDLEMRESLEQDQHELTEPEQHEHQHLVVSRFNEPLTSSSDVDMSEPQEAQDVVVKTVTAISGNTSTKPPQPRLLSTKNTRHILPAAPRVMEKPILTAARSRGVQTDPDETLVNPPFVTPHLRHHHHLAQSFGKSSTTTESDAPVSSQIPDQDETQAMINLLQGLDGKSSSLVVPIVRLALHAAKPIVNVNDMMAQALDRFDGIASQDIKQIETAVQNELDGKRIIISTHINNERKRVTALNKLCENPLPKPSFPATSSRNQTAIQKALASLNLS